MMMAGQEMAKIRSHLRGCRLKSHGGSRLPLLALSFASILQRDGGIYNSVQLNKRHSVFSEARYPFFRAQAQTARAIAGRCTGRIIAQSEKAPSSI